MSKFKVAIFSSLFPSSVRKGAGLFIRERMFRMTEHAELLVVSPIPYFPGQELITFFKKDYRPQPKKMEIQNGIKVYYPRFFSIPGLFRRLDAQMMAWCSYRLMKQLKKEHGIELIDSHFTYPDGLAATWLAKKLNTKVTITLRGTEVPHSKDPQRKAELLQAWQQADKMFTVSDSLRQHAINLGAEASKFTVIGNGVDSDKFQPLDKHKARAALKIPTDTKVMITVGGLVERKGFHRVIACLPELIKRHGNVMYLIVGGANAEGNYQPQMRVLAEQLGVSNHIRFLGSRQPSELSEPLSAADSFVLASSNEGWANVILESMACGRPVVATDVGGSREVISSDELGAIVPFGDHQALLTALDKALSKDWHAQTIVDYARNNHWDKRIELIHQEYQQLLARK